MDFSLPVARRTRASTEKIVIEMYGRKGRKKSNNGGGEKTGECSRSVGSEEKGNLVKAEKSVKGLDKAFGSEKNPISFDIDSEELGSSPESGDGSSDDNFKLSDEDEKETVLFRGERKQSNKEEEKQKKKEKEIISKKRKRDKRWYLESDTEKEEESKKKKKKKKKKKSFQYKKTELRARERQGESSEKRSVKEEEKIYLISLSSGSESDKIEITPPNRRREMRKAATRKKRRVSSESDSDGDSLAKNTEKEEEKFDLSSLSSGNESEETDRMPLNRPREMGKRATRKNQRLSSESDNDGDSLVKNTEKEEEKIDLTSLSSRSDSEETERRNRLPLKEKTSKLSDSDISISEMSDEKPAEKDEETSDERPWYSSSESEETERRNRLRLNRGKVKVKPAKLKITKKPEYEDAKTKLAKRNQNRRAKSINVVQILLNSMIGDGKGGFDGLNLGSKEEKTEVVLPLKFTWTDKEEDRLKNWDQEKQMEIMWSEFNIAVASEELGSSVTDKGEYKSDSEEDEDMRCKKGNHGNHMIDEQLGIICANCRAVILEMKYFTPDFAKNPERSDFRGYGRDRDKTSFDALGKQNPDRGPLTDTELRARAVTVWDMIPGVKDDMYPHQRAGFEFIWKHLGGGIKRRHMDALETHPGTGCIVSHAPGTGKSRLTIVFLQSFMKLHPLCRPVIIAPLSVLLTWEDEFRKWKFLVPFHNLNSPGLSGREDGVAMTVLRRGRGAPDSAAVKAAKLFSWRKGGSVLGVSYTTFEKMTAEGQAARHVLLDAPGVVVLDEGHIPRNDTSLIWKALSHIKTRKRIILSGTPFQNNFLELYNTMRVVQPDFSGARRKDWASLTKPLHNDAGGGGSTADAERLSQIKALIDPFVHVHRGHVLEKSLPGLRESIVVLEPSELQQTLLRKIHKTVTETFLLQSAVTLTSVHPSLVLTIDPPLNLTVPLPGDDLLSLRSNPHSGVKTRFLIELVRLSNAVGERVLVFSQLLQPLSLVIEHLKSEFDWRENKEILYIDGARKMKERQSAINSFNDAKSDACVLLVSTKAGGEGINLVGASRVVLLDVVWNPSVERQATRRAYRLGQKKFVYIYHLVASGTIEERKYSCQTAKARMSNLVFSSGGRISPREVAEDRVLDAMVQHEKLKDIFVNISVKDKDLDLL